MPKTHFQNYCLARGPLDQKTCAKTSWRIAFQNTVGSAGLVGAKYITWSQAISLHESGSNRVDKQQQIPTSLSKRENMHGLA